jgi:phenylacetate-CoA ligase
LFDDIKHETGKSDKEILENEKIQQAQKGIAKKIKDDIGLSMRIQLECPGTIPRSEGGKLSRILDLRKAE